MPCASLRPSSGAIRIILQPRSFLKAAAVIALISGNLAGGASSLCAEDRPSRELFGSPKVTGGIVVTEEFNDNVLAERTNKLSDAITVVSPAFNIEIANESTRWNVGGVAALGNYATYSDQNYRDYRLYTDVARKVQRNILFTGGASYAREHEDASSIEDTDRRDPTVFHAARAYAASQFRQDRSKFQIGATFDDFDFLELRDRDRDRFVFTAGVRYGYALDTRTSVFVDAKYDTRHYDQSIDYEGFRRSSNGTRLTAGIEHSLSSAFRAQIYGGWLYQRFDDSRFSTVSDADFGGEFRWTPVPGLTVKGVVGRALYDTTLNGSSSYLQTSSSMYLYKWIRPDLRLNAGVSYIDDDFQDIDRRDNVQQYSLGFRKYFSPHLYLGAGYTFSSRDSTDISESYERSVFMLRAGRTQKPAYAPKDLEASDVVTLTRDGFYVGLRGAQLAPQTKLAGARGAGGILEADFGNWGFAGAGFAGYRFGLGEWYVALEADAGRANAGWDHSRLPDGRVFSVDRGVSYGVSALVGRELSGGGAIYGRAGAVFERQKTLYKTASNSFATSETEAGLRFGVGSVLPLSNQVSLSLEHTYSAFGDYSIGPPRDPDRFVNDVSATSLGLSYSFQPRATPTDDPADVNWNGLYFGASVGHSAVSSETIGERNAGSVLRADFADTGISGNAFAGYSVRHGWLFGAAELEAGYSDTSWDHERDPTGRSFSLTKRESLGGNLRLGYMAGDAGAVYASVGVVQTAFDMEFARGDQAIKQTDRRTGFRYGLGMELPANRHLAFRFDYSFTDYGTLRLKPPGDNGVETYETNENLFRFGTVFRY